MSGWPMKSLADVCEINPRLPRDHGLTDDQPVSFVPMAAVDEISGRITQGQSRPFTEVKKGYTHFRDGDVLFAKITPCMENGKAAIASELIGGYGFGSTEFHVLRPGPELMAEWVFYFVRQHSFRQIAKQNFTGTAGQQRVPTTFMSSALIPVPPLPKQRRIVDLLSRAEGIVRLRREAEKKAAELIPALFLDMFGDPATNPKAWPTEPLANVCSINPRLSKDQKPTPETLVSFVPMASVDEFYGAIAKSEIRPYEAVSKGYTAFQSGDVLFAKITPCMENGKAAIADDLENGLGFGSTEFHVLRATDRAHRAWLYGLVRLDLFRREAKRSFTGTAGQQRVPTEYLRSIEVPIPQMRIQEKFHDALVSIRSIQSEQSNAIAKAQATFDALLAKAFS